MGLKFGLLTLREEHRLRGVRDQGAENIWTKREEVAGGWRRLHNEELHDLYTSPHVIRVIKSRRLKRDVHVARTGEMRIAYTILVENPEANRSLRRPRSTRDDNI
jgi:hypothetical protein